METISCIKNTHSILRKDNSFVYKIFIVNLSMAKIQRLWVFKLPSKWISFYFYKLCIVVLRAVSALCPVIVFVINHWDIFHSFVILKAPFQCLHVFVFFLLLFSCTVLICQNRHLTLIIFFFYQPMIKLQLVNYKSLSFITKMMNDTL